MTQTYDLQKMDRHLAKRVSKMDGAQQRVAFLSDLFGPRHARRQYMELLERHPDLFVDTQPQSC